MLPNLELAARAWGQSAPTPPAPVHLWCMSPPACPRSHGEAACSSHLQESVGPCVRDNNLQLLPCMAQRTAPGAWRPMFKPVATKWKCAGRLDERQIHKDWGQICHCGRLPPCRPVSLRLSCGGDDDAKLPQPHLHRTFLMRTCIAALGCCRCHRCSRGGI